MFFSFFLAFSNLYIWVFLCQGDTFVNHRVRESATWLTAADFRTARNPAPDQPLDWEKQMNPDLVEGDITGLSWPNFTQTIRDATFISRDSFVHSAVRDRYKLWPSGTVPIVVSKKYTNKAKAKIAAGIKEFHSRTCIKFVDATRSHRNYVYIRPTGRGCSFEGVGRSSTRGEQTMSLDFPACFQHGTILHELMHSLGFFHEHNRHDRDRYVQIYRENIKDGEEIQFRKRRLETIDHLDTPYDYSSVMHYHAYAFSKNGFPTIGVPLDRLIVIGQRKDFSDYDVMRINLLYQCTEYEIGPTVTRPPIRPTVTPNSGQPLPRDCADLNEKVRHARNGVYEIQPSGSHPISVYCDMESLGGGWTVFQRRMNGEVNFRRNWADYKRGFGRVSREHWLGNDAIHRLTARKPQELLVELREANRGCVLHAQFSGFSIANEADNYRLHVGNSISATRHQKRTSRNIEGRECLTLHNGMEFSTADKDNDTSERINCAHMRHGGWWYKNCGCANLNGLYSNDTCVTQSGHIVWYHAHGWHYSFPWTEIKMRSADFKLANGNNNWCEYTSCHTKCEDDLNC